VRSRSRNHPDANQQWVITAYTLAFGSLLLLGGRIGDLHGTQEDLLNWINQASAAASALGGIALNTRIALLHLVRYKVVFGALISTCCALGNYLA
jgi:MFS family permease